MNAILPAEAASAGVSSILAVARSLPHGPDHSRVFAVIKASRDIEQLAFLARPDGGQVPRYTAHLSHDADMLRGFAARNLDMYSCENPQFDNRLSPLDARNFFFVYIVDEAMGSVVATQATRLRDLGNKNLKQAWEDNSFLYDDPETGAAEGERAEVTAPVADRITGRVSWVGDLATRPSYRRNGLSERISALTRAVAFAHFDPDWHTSGVMAKHVSVGTANAWPHDFVEDGIKWERPGALFDGSVDLWLMATPRDGLRRRIEAGLAPSLVAAE